MAAVTRRQYKGAATSTTITAGINSSATSCSLDANTGWPSSSGVPFYVVIDPGTSSEEKCSATIAGTTLTLTRGQDDTTAAAHASGAVIYPVFSADEADEANLFASTMTTRGDLLTMGSGPTVARLAIGSNSGYVLKTDGTDPSWGQVAAAGIASDAVTTVKILDSAVTSAKIANDTIVDADINSAAAIVDTKLATIATAGKVSNSATTAASANTASAIVARDASGNFTAGTITAALTGTASGNLVAGGALGTPSSGTLTNCTFPTLNQNTTGNAATATNATNATNATYASNLNGFNKGSNVVTTNGSGLASYAHGLGSTPTTILVHNGDLGAYFGQINFWSVDATNITIAAGASLTVRVNWVAYL